MAKTPALSTQLKAAQAKIAELESKLADTSRSKDSQYQARQTAEAELEQLHQMLDAVPNPVAKREEGGYQDRRVITRLAAWLAASRTH